MSLPFPGGDGLVLIEDSRQQEGKHKNIHTYCQRNGIQIVRQKLDVGDYMVGEIDDNGEVHPVGNISADSKVDLLEISKNIMSDDHRRFRAECQLAKELGIQLVIVVEEIPPYGKVDLWQVPVWKSSNQFHRYGDPMTLVDPKALRKAMITMMQKYGVRFEFCSRQQSPKRIIKILNGG